jgi:hypothetical protein
MTQDQVENRIAIAVGFGRITTKDVIHPSAVVFAARKLAVAVIIRFATRICEALELVSFWEMNQCEVRVCVSAWGVILEIKCLQAILEPVLEMELFVSRASPHNQLPIADRVYAILEQC